MNLRSAFYACLSVICMAGSVLLTMLALCLIYVFWEATRQEGLNPLTPWHTVLAGSVIIGLALIMSFLGFSLGIISWKETLRN